MPENQKREGQPPAGFFLLSMWFIFYVQLWNEVFLHNLFHFLFINDDLRIVGLEDIIVKGLALPFQLMVMDLGVRVKILDGIGHADDVRFGHIRLDNKIGNGIEQLGQLWNITYLEGFFGDSREHFFLETIFVISVREYPIDNFFPLKIGYLFYNRMLIKYNFFYFVNNYFGSISIFKAANIIKK